MSASETRNTNRQRGKAEFAAHFVLHSVRRTDCSRQLEIASANRSHFMQAPQPIERPTLELQPWKRVGISRAHAYELMLRGEFPRPLKIGRASRFLVSEIDAWIAERIAERDGAAERVRA